MLYSNTAPIFGPTIISLPHNGIRLCFDGPDQRLRLIEVLDFTRVPIIYEGGELIKAPENREIYTVGISSHPTGPPFKQIYHKQFGPTVAGEYFPPADTSPSSYGTYVLSYPGVAFSFPLQHSSWSLQTDFVSLLSSAATLNAKALCIFEASSWKNAREGLFTRACKHPRSLTLGGRGREKMPDEIELVRVCGNGIIDMIRRSSASFKLLLGETTPQDLVAELGPPDAIHRKSDRRLGIHKIRTQSHSAQQPKLRASLEHLGILSDSDRISSSSAIDDSDGEESAIVKTNTSNSSEYFYNYFRHGFDILVSYPLSRSHPLSPSFHVNEESSTLATCHLVATKILLHANLPGSFPFNRYRRSRWVVDPRQIGEHRAPITSETSYKLLSASLREVWKSSYANAEEERSLQQPFGFNRSMGDSPGSSCELLGGREDGANVVKKIAADSGKSFVTELHGFPGLLFEVWNGDSVCCLTVY